MGLLSAGAGSLCGLGALFEQFAGELRGSGESLLVVRLPGGFGQTGHVADQKRGHRRGGTDHCVGGFSGDLEELIDVNIGALDFQVANEFIDPLRYRFVEECSVCWGLSASGMVLLVGFDPDVTGRF